MGSQTDVVYLVGEQASYDELRYSLRSVAAHLAHRRVWLVGACPPWALTEHIGTRQHFGKWHNQELNLRAACEHPAVSDPFVLFNDDFFVLRPTVDVPALHGGPIVDVIAARRGSGEWMRRLRHTADHCGPDALAYDAIHVPMVLRKQRTIQVLDEIADRPMLFRSVYGNRWRIGGRRHPNVKVTRAKGDLAADEAAGWRFVSTADGSFARSPIGRRLRSMFPDPGPYEC